MYTSHYSIYIYDIYHISYIYFRSGLLSRMKERNIVRDTQVNLDGNIIYIYILSGRDYMIIYMYDIYISYICILGITCNDSHRYKYKVRSDSSCSTTLIISLCTRYGLQSIMNSISLKLTNLSLTLCHVYQAVTLMTTALCDLHFSPYVPGYNLSHIITNTYITTAMYHHTYHHSHVSPHLSPQSCITTLITTVMYHHTYHHSHISPHLSPQPCTTTLITTVIYHHPYHHSHVSPPLSPQSCIPTLITTVMYHHPYHHSHVSLPLSPQSCITTLITTVKYHNPYHHSHVSPHLSPQSCITTLITTVMYHIHTVTLLGFLFLFNL